MLTGSARLPDWARVFGEPAARARLRSKPADFVVTEELGFEPSGDGEHDYLFVEKTNLTTHRVAAELAKTAGVPRRAVGYSGMKDRRACTRQWFSVQRAPGRTVDWAGFGAEGLSVLESTRHRRKLKRGVHRSNRFRVVLREFEDPDSSVLPRLERVRTLGVPNYFGEQRFGRDGGNVALAQAFFSGRRLPREKRSIALSAARSLIFNDLLSARVADASWNTLRDGDIAGLDGSGSVFAVETVDEALRTRCAALDVHPTGPLWGAGAPMAEGAPAALERRTARSHAALCRGLETWTEERRRALRMPVRDLDWAEDDATLTLGFSLARGSFATALLRELIDYAP